MGSDRAYRILELLRAHVVGWRVDEIPCQAHAINDTAEILPVDVTGEFELVVPGLRLAIARETVAAEREGERRKLRIVRRIGEAIGPCRQQGGERAGPKQVLVRILGGLEGEQNLGEPA